jgi:hypothetical protein
VVAIIGSFLAGIKAWPELKANEFFSGGALLFYALVILVLLAVGMLAVSRRVPFEINPPGAPSHLTAVDEGGIRAEDRIQIIAPRPGEVLTEPAPFGKDFSYMVRGRLKSVPDGRSGKVWPQNFDPVQFNEGEWHGRIHAGAVTPLRIFAVVAPPTSQMLFRYYQERGQETNTYAPLPRVPPECHNRHSVQATLP